MIAQYPIFSANTLPIDQGGGALPQMSSTVEGYFQPLILTRIQRMIVDQETKQVPVTQQCMGVIQPLSPRDLKLKSEGERKWTWLMLHTTPDVNLEPAEEFIVGGQSYRIMGASGFDAYGFRYYEVVLNYQRG